MTKKITLLLACGLLYLKGHSQSWTNGQNANYAMSAVTLTTSGLLTNTDSTFSSPVAQVCMVADPKHNFLYVADFFGHRVLRFDYPVIKNIPAANLVFGQPTFYTATPNNGGLSASSFQYPSGLAIDTVSGTLWVSDMGNHRILRFDSAFQISTNNPSANQVLGQPSFTTNASSLSQSGITYNNAPQTGGLIHFDHNTGTLWLCDNGSNRVLRYDNAKTKPNGANADAVLGQTLYTTNSAGLSATAFGRPDGITTIGSSLFVSDVTNNRVLRFDNVYAKANGAAADAVFGQTSFVTNTGGVSATTLYQPSGLTSEGNNLYVTELQNKRVLIFNSATSNTVASNVLLAGNFTTVGSAALTPSTGGQNSTIFIEPVEKQLFVQDRTNKRILVFNACGSAMISGSNTFCSNSNSITLTASGATSYSWNTGATTSTIAVSPTVSTVYTVVATATAGCLNNPVATFSVNVINTPTLTIVSTPSALCEGQTATLSVSGASGYTWSTASNSSSIVVSPSVTSGYSVTGINSGCTSADSLILAVNANPTISATSSSSLLCAGQSATLTAVGASSYSWTNGTANAVTVISPTTTTNYTVTGTNNAGCSSSYTIAQAVSPCTGIETNSDMAGGISLYPNPNNGEFQVYVNVPGDLLQMQVLNTLGQVVYEQQINHSANNLSLTNLPKGIYILKITDNNNLIYKSVFIKN